MKRRNVLRTVVFIILVFLMLPRDKVRADYWDEGRWIVVMPKINDSTYISPMGKAFSLPSSYDLKIGSNEWIQEPYTYKMAASDIADLDKSKGDLIPKKPGKVVVSQYKKGKFNKKITVYITELVYEYENGALTVKGTLTKNPNIKIPETIGGIKVAEIGFQSFMHWDGKSIEIPDSVKTLGTGAFSNCDNLERVKLGNGITTIYNLVFFECKNLVEINIPDSTKFVGDRVFYSCNKLDSLEIPKGLKQFGKEAFDETEWLYKKQEENPYVIVNGVLINAITAGEHAIIPEGVTVIGDGAFFNDWDLETVEVPSGVKEIGRFAFDNCYCLTGVKLPDGVKKIGDRAFYLCNVLEDVEIPKSVDYIGMSAFLATKWLEKKQKENPLVIVSDIVIDGTTLKGTVTIPEGVTNICDIAFYDNRKITKLVLPSSISVIGEGAFDGTHSLKTIEVHRKGVIDIGSNAFGNLKGTFYGYKNSYIQTYAKENKFNFKVIK